MRSAKRCASLRAEALADMSAHAIGRLITFAPSLAESIFEQKHALREDVRSAEAVLVETLETRRDLLGKASTLSHRRRVTNRTRDLIGLAMAVTEHHGAAQIDRRHGDVSTAMHAVHRDQLR
jgi:hypothetical protein